MAAEAAAVNLCGRIARPPFLALVAATGPARGRPSGPKPSGAFRQAWELASVCAANASERDDEEGVRHGQEQVRCGKSKCDTGKR